jgi:CRP-like cAMP-binding protein
MMTTDVERLRRYPCFQSLTTKQLELMTTLATEECYDPEHTLCREGSPGTRLFLLAKGNVEVLFRIGEEGSSCVDRVGPGEIIGCSLLIEPYAYTATCRTISEVEALVIDAEALRAQMQEDCPLGIALQREIIRILVHRTIDLRIGPPIV